MTKSNPAPNTDPTLSKGTEELREQMRHVFNRYRRYLVGPVPSDLLYGGPDVEPFDVLVDEALAITAKQVAAARIDEATQHLENLLDNRECVTCYSNYCKFRDRLTALTSTEQPSKGGE